MTEIQTDEVDRSEPVTTGEEPQTAPFVPEAFTPESPDETVRRSGLAWSAGIIFFTTIAFMLLLGWIADLLLGSKPWGLVGGIILGSIIGFVQFFRISSQIFAPDQHKPEIRPLFGDDKDEE